METNGQWATIPFFDAKMKTVCRCAFRFRWRRIGGGHPCSWRVQVVLAAAACCCHTMRCMLHQHRSFSRPSLEWIFLSVLISNAALCLNFVCTAGAVRARLDQNYKGSFGREGVGAGGLETFWGELLGKKFTFSKKSLFSP